MTIEQEARDIVFEMDLHGEGEIKSAIKGIAKALQAKQDRIEELDHILNDHPNDVLRTCYQKIKTLESALKRLSSHEAFAGPRMIDKQTDKELLARMDFAKKAIGGGNG